MEREGAIAAAPVLEGPSGLRVQLDGETGLPASLAARPGGPLVPLSLAIELESDGEETPDVMGGLTYRRTNRYEVTALRAGTLRHVTSGPNDSYELEAVAGEWRVRCRLLLRAEHPRIALHLSASPREPSAERPLRTLRVRAELGAGELEEWSVEAPGNTLRPGIRASTVTEPATIFSANHELGSPGFVALHRAEPRLTGLVWPFSRSEQTLIELRPAAGAIELELDTQLAGLVGPGEWLEHGPIYLDVLESSWPEVRDQIKCWYPSMGLTLPDDGPRWASAANILEVMVGSTPFHGGYEYAPYPSLRELIDDLDRIGELGTGCLQLMPRHPYPSYNIHEPGDVETTYGDPEELRELVAACHERGIRIILDLLIHGVLDRAILARTVDLIRSGPHADRLDDPCTDVYSHQSVEISWCRHVLAFEPYWMEGAPDRHPLLEAHPEWFMRNSAGEVAGVYTNALDTANVEWQDHFVATCERLAADYGIDGFRLDAPLYNRFANWSEATRRHASYSSLGALPLIRKLRRRLRAISEDLLIYSEPGGSLVRESLDLSYGYEEQWLISSLCGRRGAEEHAWRRVRTGHELVEWFRDYDLASPEHATTAHFVDAHDTVWWRLEGDLWRREQIGLGATKALLAIYALRGGAYMTFVGGELQLEHELRLAHRLRRELPELRYGAADYEAAGADHEAIYVVLRHSGDRAALVAVNTSGSELRAEITADVGDPANPRNTLDAWTGERVTGEPGQPGVRFELPFAPFQARVLLLNEPPVALNP